MDTDSPIHDIHPPLTLPEPFPWLTWLVGGILALLLIAVGAWVWMRLRRPPKADPYTLCLAELDILTNPESTFNDNHFASELSRIIRAFTHEMLGIHALEMTEPEFFQKLGYRFASSGIDIEPLNHLARACERAKFGQITLAPDQRETLLVHAREISDSIKTLATPEDG